MGPNLQKLRLNAGLSQEAVVAKLTLMGITWVSREILSQMELGKYSVRISILLALKEVYAVGFDDFFQGLTWRDIPIDEIK
ncbi:MAG: helix-turn-helix transcriptional regulator [Oscillospiraceae bacterium]